MRWWNLLFAIVTAGCEHDAKPAPDICIDYRQAVQAARAEAGSEEVELRNGCGCPSHLRTTPARAAAARDALARVTAAQRMCWVNCDQPCGADDSRW